MTAGARESRAAVYQRSFRSTIRHVELQLRIFCVCVFGIKVASVALHRPPWTTRCAADGGSLALLLLLANLGGYWLQGSELPVSVGVIRACMLVLRRSLCLGLALAPGQAECCQVSSV